VTSTKAKPYSMDDNIAHFQEVIIRFEKGLPVKVSSNGKEWTDSLELFIALNELGKLHGIGRIDIVEVHNRNPVLL
jgi:argininosuccinate synthase